VNFREIEGQMKLAHEEFSTIRGLSKPNGHPIDKQRLDDAWRNYNEIRKKYHIKKAEIVGDTLRLTGT